MGLARCAAGVRMMVRIAVSPLDVFETSDFVLPRFPAVLSVVEVGVLFGSVALLVLSGCLAGGADWGE